jgi:hypothetical protein
MLSIVSGDDWGLEAYASSLPARVAGLDIGNYNGAWDKLFQNSIEA